LLKKQPAALAGRPASKSKYKHRPLDIEASSPSKPHNRNYSPAELRPAPDDRGEDDRTFFSRRPGINDRKRLAFEGEPPAGVRDDNVAFICVRLERDAAGLPATIIREIAYGDWGHA
jgi:hypothetical protein